MVAINLPEIRNAVQWGKKTLEQWNEGGEEGRRLEVMYCLMSENGKGGNSDR